MKKLLTLFLALAVLVGALFILKGSNRQNEVPFSPTPTISENNTLGFCKPSDLSSVLSSEGAAGSIYLTLNIKNISGKNCQIIGNNFIALLTDAKNISVKTQGQTGPEVITLTPNQIVYSQVHYPNGPQCSGQVLENNISYKYNISESDSITFKTQNGETKQTIGVCKSNAENTQIDVWSLSEKPLNQ